MTEKSFTAGVVLCPTCKARTVLQDQPWKRVCVTCYLAQKAIAPTTAPAAPLELDMLRRLIQLCHPDKHSNSDASTTATRYLLALKEAAHG